LADTARPLRILVIEDEALDREVLRRLLARAVTGPLEVLEAETLQEGVELAATERLDCIFLDLNLPDGDGLDLFEELADRGGRAAPVVVTTGLVDPRKIERAQRLGCRTWLDKCKLSTEALREILESLEP
jgi:CheY-like chemotaxis protein